MDSSDEEVLLESCCLVIIIRSKSKGKGKGRCVSMIENLISGCLYNELFSESKKENVRPFKVWLDTLLFIKMLLKTGQLPSKHFPSCPFIFLYFLFHKGKDTSAISQQSVQHLVYIFPIFFRFHKCFNNFHLSKSILVNNFFH